MAPRIPQYYFAGSPELHYAISTAPLIPAGVLAYLFALRPADAHLLPPIPIFVAITAALVLTPRFRLSEDLENIGRRMPYMILKLRTLLMVGEHPIQAFVAAARDVRSPLLNIIIKRMLLGEPPEEIVEQLRREVGSRRELDILKRILASLQMGEQTLEYLRREFEGLMGEKELALRRALESLSVIMELYATGGVFAPVVGILIIASLSMLGGGIDVTLLLSVVVFILVPIFSAFTAVIARKFVEGAMI
ncbi:MAG: hypothetical protein DRO12_03985 [Thermoprotei archaeon]|nr:MAG: hypothetical protein DRO12_03985 [Thermoprotei archaeon]